MSTTTKIGDTITKDGIPYLVRSVQVPPLTYRRFGVVAVLHLKRPRGAKWYLAHEYKNGTVDIFGTKRGA